MWVKLTEFYPATVHGVSTYFGPTLTRVRLPLLTVWLAMCIAFCLYEFTNTFNSFLAFGIKTKKDSVEIGAEGVDFPAITFCSASVVRRTVVGGVEPIRTPLIMMATGISDPVELDQLGQMCTANSTAAEATHLINAVFGGFLNSLASLRETQVDSVQSAVSCKWNGRDINCAESFINKPTDAGFCFTFNPALELLKTYELQASKAINTSTDSTVITYGMTSSVWKLYISKNTGPKSGFSVVLLTNTTDYCASYLGYGGFVATVHDPMSEPLTWSKNGINLSPGWQTNVAMSLTKTDRRKTEYRGYCKSQLDLLTFKKVVDYTSRDYFILDCLTKQIISECQCVPFYAPRGNVYFNSDFPNVQFSITNRSFIYTCGFTIKDNESPIICQQQVEKKALKADGNCYLDAPKPCEETQIYTKTTASRWPNAALLPHLKRHINGTADMSLEKFQQNFISANFFFEDYHYTLVTESLKMTWVDLMNQLGGAMGMSVGLSILGVVELLVWLLTRPIVIFSNYHSNTSQNNLLCKQPAYKP